MKVLNIIYLSILHAYFIRVIELSETLYSESIFVLLTTNKRNISKKIFGIRHYITFDCETKKEFDKIWVLATAENR